MSDTPRTDAALRGRTIEGYGRVEYIKPEFARQLERENAELLAANAELMTAGAELRAIGDGYFTAAQRDAWDAAAQPIRDQPTPKPANRSESKP